MFSKSSSDQPSPVYVFIVLSLAAFLTLFTVWRRPRAQYSTEVAVRASERVQDATTDEELLAMSAELRKELLSPESVLQSLQNAGMVRGDAKPEMLAIAGEVAGRMQANYFSNQDQAFMRVGLRTEHPKVGETLLNQMMLDLKDQVSKNGTTLEVNSAISRRIRGTAVAPSSLLLLILCSSLFGILGLALLEKTKDGEVLLTNKDVTTTARLPVIADFASDQEIPERTRQLAWHRRFQLVVRVAEVSIAAVVLLMFYNLATQQPFPNLLVQDPLAAYNDALGRLLG